MAPSSSKPGSPLPSFYGETRQDGSVIERPPARATDHLQRPFTSYSASASPEIKPIPVADRPASIVTDGARHRKWAIHRPTGTVQVNRNRNYNNAIGVPSRQPASRGNNVVAMSSSDSSSSESDSESLRRRRRQRRREKRARLRELEQQQPLRIPWTQWMASETKNHFVAVVGEFIGTFLFLFFAFAATGVANIGSGATSNNTTTAGDVAFNPTVELYISLAFGFSLMVNAWIFFRISGGLFNPAVTLALALVRAVHVGRSIFLFAAQIGGACFASYIVKVLFPTDFNVQTTLSPDTTLAQGVFIEAICTAELVFTIVMLAKEKHKATYIAPVGIGLALFIGELVSVYYTGGALNPARAFGPAAVTHNFVSEHWIYWVGPIIGTLLAVGFYKMIKVLEYEMANPGQDGDVHNDPTQNPEHELAQVVQEREAEVQEIQELKEELAIDADKVDLVAENQAQVADDQKSVLHDQQAVKDDQAKVVEGQEGVADKQAEVAQQQNQAADRLAVMTEEVKKISSTG